MGRRYSEKKMKADILAWEDDAMKIKKLCHSEAMRMCRKVRKILREGKFKLLKPLDTRPSRIL